VTEWARSRKVTFPDGRVARIGELDDRTGKRWIEISDGTSAEVEEETSSA
jgi:hypothetical protein